MRLRRYDFGLPPGVFADSFRADLPDDLVALPRLVVGGHVWRPAGEARDALRVLDWRSFEAEWPRVGKPAGEPWLKRLAGVGHDSRAVVRGEVAILNQSTAGGFNIKNTMELANHLSCNNAATGRVATSVQLYYR